MKKNLLLVCLLSFVFLGLGNVSFAQTPQTCSDYDNSWLPQNSDGSCPVGYTPDGFSAGGQVVNCCNKQPDGSTKELCNVAGSKYVSKPHSQVSVPGVSCECAQGYGEADDPFDGKKQCLPCSDPGVCCGIKLNTNVPFIGDCIETKSQNPAATIDETNAFPVLVGALVKILVSVILIVCFILIIVGGVMWTTGNAKGGKDLIVKVAIGLAVLGASGIILRLVNPNFFG